MLPRRHRDRDRAAGTRAVHVQWGVADDRDALERELATRDDARALAGDSGQAAAIHVVRAHGVRKIGEGGGDEHENINVHLVARSDTPNFVEQKRAEGFGIDVKLLIFMNF